MKNIVVVGASLAGHHAARTLRHLGFDGTLTVIGAEPHHPYDRYPLSKAFLTGDTDRGGLDLDDPGADVSWRLGAEATGVDLSRRVVTVDERTEVSYDGLVVASGARPRDSDTVQGVERAFVLRTVDDADRLRRALTGRARRVVVVGGGLIGAEIASTAVGFGHDTTLVHSGTVPTSHSLGLPVAGHLLALHRKAGVRIIPRSRAARLEHSHGRVTGVLLADRTRVPADIAVMATGTKPNVGWLEAAGLDVRDGLACGPSLHALGNDRVVGAGDAVRAPHRLLGGELARTEHWASAIDQATLAATNLLHGSTRSWCAMPRFGTTIHGAGIRAVGFPQLANRSQVIWGAIGAETAVVALFRGDTPVAAVSLNAADHLDDHANRLWPDLGQPRPE
ncbi:FAD/NAD(P)-binding oxidoreductase [Kribbella sp.]|uniref:NAD(P)/FAD-dependent oxidoreductase n=1 Tax=Kribbella sp. TaxID=1871183 RepID=UPI002D2F5A79|nr:FAD/NAD(P)-binding oxidoreductase [Kribbella sp.]HZX03886.1 FAD/NAD(P)-binding oxidoreductase [Kribbella sp.]